MKARGLIEMTLAQLNRPSLSTTCKRYMSRFFFLNPTRGPSVNELETIKSIIILTMNGLSSDMTIKVGTNVGYGDENDYGEVRGVLNGENTKSYHNQITYLGTGEIHTMGAIKIDQDRLLSSHGVKTLIHEATHKYAGTIDYCYFDDNGKEQPGTRLYSSEALKNADSYAWFIYKMGNKTDSAFAQLERFVAGDGVADTGGGFFRSSCRV